MKFIDFSPSASPSVKQQRDALQKGLGRAVQWAGTGLLADDPLLDACLTDQRYDMQVEDSRTDWLWRMIEILNAKDRFRVPILHALYDLTDDRSAYQLCELGCRYAQAGDDTFLTRLYEIVESRPFEDSPGLGESEILRLDGDKAFAFVARIRGEELAQRDWEWHDRSFVEDAIELLGESAVRRCLEYSDDSSVHQFQLQRRDNEGMKRPKGSSHKKRMRAIKVTDILTEAANQKPSLGFFRGWGMHAEDSDLKTVLERLLESTKPPEIVSLLRVFSNRALPTFDPRLIQLCHHSNEDVTHWAFNALEKNSNDMIRQFALDRLHAGDRRAIGLFIENYESGDEQTILNCIELPADQFERHSILLDVIKVLEENPVADASQLGVVAFASTPCDICRMYAARCLHKQKVAPDWLTEECRFDSVDDTRAFSDSVTNDSRT